MEEGLSLTRKIKVQAILAKESVWHYCLKHLELERLRTSFKSILIVSKRLD